MRAYIVTEGEDKAALVRRVLPGLEEESVHVVAGTGRSSAVSLARSLLADRHKPVLLLLDSGSVDERWVREQRAMVGELVHAAALRTPAEVVFADPAVEAALFHSPDDLARTLAVQVTPEERLEGKYRPGPVLEGLIRRSGAVHGAGALVEKIDDAYASRIAQHPFFREVARFLDTALDAETSGHLAGNGAGPGR